MDKIYLQELQGKSNINRTQPDYADGRDPLDYLVLSSDDTNNAKPVPGGVVEEPITDLSWLPEAYRIAIAEEMGDDYTVLGSGVTDVGFRNLTFVPFVIVNAHPEWFEDDDEALNFILFFRYGSDNNTLFGFMLDGNKVDMTTTYTPSGYQWLQHFSDEFAARFGQERHFDHYEICLLRSDDVIPTTVPAVYQRTIPNQPLDWLPENYQQALSMVPNPYAAVLLDTGLGYDQFRNPIVYVVVMGILEDGMSASFLLCTTNGNRLGVASPDEEPYTIISADGYSVYTDREIKLAKHITEVITGYLSTPTQIVEIPDYTTIVGSTAPKMC